MAMVEIYTQMMCGYCVRAKSLLDKKSIPYTEIHIHSGPDVRKEMIQRANGKTTAPQIFIDGKSIGGCDELYALENAGKLDPMLAGK